MEAACARTGRSQRCACAGAAARRPSATPATGARSVRPREQTTTRRPMLSRTAPLRVDPPPLPHARGPLSAAVLGALHGEPALRADPAGADPYGDDLQLALYCCYELHYRGFAGVPDEREWDAALFGLRRAMERRFLQALRADVDPGDDLDAAVAALLVEPVG